MKQKEVFELCAYAGVFNLVEKQTAERSQMSVATLRVLLRVAGLLGTGASLRGQDVGKAETSAKKWSRVGLKRLRKGERWLVLVDGQTRTGRYQLTPAGKKVCKEFTSAWRRAVANFLALEPVSPYRRKTPKKT